MMYTLNTDMTKVHSRVLRHVIVLWKAREIYQLCKQNRQYEF